MRDKLSSCTAPGDQINPAIYTDVVVWVDRRNFYTEIYGTRLPLANNEQTQNILPAPTLTPTPLPTPTPKPLTPEIPRLISPANNSVVDTLLPVLSFDTGTQQPNLHLQWGFSTGGEEMNGGWDCNEDQGTSVIQCVPQNNLKPGSTYTWQAKTYYTECTGGDCFVSSEERSFTITDQPIIPPPAPVLIVPINGASVDYRNVELQWKPVEGAILYQIGWGPCPDNFFTSTTSESAGHVSPPDLEPGKTYCWGVRARDQHAWSEWSKATFDTAP